MQMWPCAMKWPQHWGYAIAIACGIGMASLGVHVYPLLLLLAERCWVGVLAEQGWGA